MAERSLEERIQRLEDVHAIQNLMGRYEYYHTAGLHEETADLFAKKAPDVKAEFVGWGVYEGLESIRKMFVNVHKALEGDRRGVLNVLPLTTPVIEVAGDGKTAKGVWIMTGVETMKISGKLEANWAWAKYGIDFIKEDGEWKFWHFHVYAVFHTPFGTSWVDAPGPVPFNPPEELAPDRPCTYHWVYSPTAITENVPEPPLPYETWDDSMSYVK